MKFKKFGQTATEYLIILAVVIILALIVVGVLGGIPGIGGGASTSANSAYFATAPIGIVGLAAGVGDFDITIPKPTQDTIVLRNNLQDAVTVDFIAFGDQIIKNSSTTLRLRPGETVTYAGDDSSSIQLIDNTNQWGPDTYTWAFKSCFKDWNSGGINGAGPWVYDSLPFSDASTTTTASTYGTAGDTFAETITIQYTNTKTSATYTWESDEKYSSTCAN